MENKQTTQDNTQKTLIQRMQLIAGQLRTISKDMEVNKTYKAVSDLNVTKKVKEAELEHGIFSIAKQQELVKYEMYTAKNGTVYHSFLIKMVVTFYNTDNQNDFINVESFGHGLDSGDKGFGKASTYARKYALLNAYKIATGEDPDQEASEKVKLKPEKPSFPSEEQDPDKFFQVAGYLRDGYVTRKDGSQAKFTIADVKRKYAITKDVEEQLKQYALFDE